VCAAAVAALVTGAWLVRRWLVTSRERIGHPSGEGLNGRVAAAAR